MIIIPLLLTLGYDASTLLAAALLLGFRLCRLDELPLVLRLIAYTAVARATVITYCDYYNYLMAACRFPNSSHVATRSIRAGYADADIPFYYLENCKRPGQKHFFRAVILKELLVVWLAYI